MKKNLIVAFETPWKLINEVLMYVFRPFVLIYLYLNGVKIGSGSKFYGFPLVQRHWGSRITIGNNFECRNWWFSNPIGLAHPTILCTWKEGAEIVIGDDIGISGGSIVCSKKIEIQSGTIIGANSTIIDTDFHPVKSEARRYDLKNVGVKPVKIGRNVFIGMSTIILKGSIISENAVIPAASIIRHE